MIHIAIIAKNGRTYRFLVPEGSDFLSTLDIFLKKNTLDKLHLKHISVFCTEEELTACRVAKITVAGLQFTPTPNKHKRGKFIR